MLHKLMNVAPEHNIEPVRFALLVFLVDLADNIILNYSIYYLV